MSNKEKDLIYFNIKKYYDGETTFDFDENRVDEILKNPSDYELTITRFSIPSIAIPILFDVPNRYQILIDFGGVQETAYVDFPSNTSSTKPLYPPYFSVWSYNEIVDGINSALKTAHDNMKTNTPTFPPNTACKMTYDSTTKLFSLYATTGYSAVNVKVYFNNDLFQLMNSFQFKQTSFPPILPPYYQIVIKDNNNNGSTYGGGGYVMTQNFSTTQQMSTLNSLIFETNSVPVDPEFLGSQNNETRIVISDFYVERTVNDRYNLEFSPKGALLYTNLVQKSPINRIDLKVSWIDNDGNVRNLIGDVNSPFDVKLLFRKKLGRRLQETEDEL